MCGYRMHIHMACDLLQLLKKFIRYIQRTSKLTEGLLVGLVRLVSSFKATYLRTACKGTDGVSTSEGMHAKQGIRETTSSFDGPGMLQLHFQGVCGFGKLTHS